MRTVVKILFVAFFLAPFSVNAQEGKRNQKAVIKTNIYCDHCKECETCGQTFQSELLKIKGLKMYELDENEMTITVYFDSKKTDLQTIKTAITNLGYDADELEANKLAYDKLDGCCKKV